MKDGKRAVLRAVVDANELDLEVDWRVEDAADDGPQGAGLVVNGHENGELVHWRSRNGSARFNIVLRAARGGDSLIPESLAVG